MKINLQEINRFHELSTTCSFEPASLIPGCLEPGTQEPDNRGLSNWGLVARSGGSALLAGAVLGLVLGLLVRAVAFDGPTFLFRLWAGVCLVDALPFGGGTENGTTVYMYKMHFLWLVPHSPFFGQQSFL